MAKNIMPVVQDALENHSANIVLLVKLEMDTDIIRVATTETSMFWDEGSGDEEYLGAGHLATISASEESSDLSTYSLTVGLAGLPTTAEGANPFYDVFMNVDYRNKPAYIYLGVMDEFLELVGEPILIFAGRSSTATIEVGETANISVDIISRLADWERSRGGRYTHQYQTNYVDANDRGFEYVSQIREIEIRWGGDAWGAGPTILNKAQN
jgi:hypothetical protein